MSNYSEALAAAASYCSLSEHCTSEVAEKVKRFELTNEELERLMQRLQTEGYLNERRFVNAFVKDKFRFSKWGRIKIRYALRQKGISTPLAEEGLLEIAPDDYRELLLDLLRQKKRSIKAGTSFEQKSKLYRFAAGRGFEPEQINACLRVLGLDDVED